MNKPAINLQDGFLNQVRRERIAVTISLINGVKLHGLVKGFDNFTIILDSNANQQTIYKCAISVMVPDHRLPNLEEE